MARASGGATPGPRYHRSSTHLDKAFERSFDTAPQTNQRFYLGIDVSGSLGSLRAMAMAIARREPNYYIAGFANGRYINPHDSFPTSVFGRGAAMAPLSITADDSLADAVHKTQALDFGRTSRSGM